MHIKSFGKNDLSGVPEEVLKIEYLSSQDGIEDWALFWPGENTKVWVVCIHGHGSQGDQLYTRQDIRENWLPAFKANGFSILTPNLRGNSWMSPGAAVDVHDLIEFAKTKYEAETFIFYSASMGGTSNLIYAALHPEDVSAVVSLGAATDLASYWKWCRGQSLPILHEISDSISSFYGGKPEDVPEIYNLHSALNNAEKLTMPVYISHGAYDTIIPVDQVRQIKNRLTFNENFEYAEVEGGDHDSPIYDTSALGWVLSLLNC